MKSSFSLLLPRAALYRAIVVGALASGGSAVAISAVAEPPVAAATSAATPLHYVVAFRHGDAETGRQAAIDHSLDAVAQRLGAPVSHVRALAGGADLVAIGKAMPADAIASAFAAEREVALAEPDRPGEVRDSTRMPDGDASTGSTTPVKVSVIGGMRLSDTIDALAWVSGGAVGSNAASPRPARVIQLDVAGECGALQGAVDLARRNGAVVLATEALNCQGVLLAEPAALGRVGQAAAQIISRNPELNPDQVASLIRSHSRSGSGAAIAMTDIDGVTRALDALARAAIPVVSATASSNDGNLPAHAIDGNPATRWSALGDGQWLQLDLGSRVSVGGVNIAWHQGDRRQARFDVETSDTGSSWQRVFSGVSSGNTLAAEPYRFTATAARYVRIVGHGNTVNLWNSVAETTVEAAQVVDTGNDLFGVRMLYPTVLRGETWFMNMTNPNTDPRFDPDGSAPLVRNSDGSWRFQNDGDNDAARLDVSTSAGYDQDDVEDNHGILATRGYMHNAKDWKNIEITGYIRLRDAADMTDAFTWYARGGKHSNPKPFCEGSAYKGDLFFNGNVQTAKEQWHVNYDFRPSKPTAAIAPIKDKWTGFKVVMYNQNANRATRLELWTDETNTNKWTRRYETTDSGGWGSQARTCRAAVADQVISWGGPLAVFRWDNVRKVDFRHLSVREIQPPVQ